jgi:hypothetical protein
MTNTSGAGHPSVRRSTRLHGAAAAVFCLALPAGSWIHGHGWLAWRMFSSSETYRLRVTVWDTAGVGRQMAPTELASRARHQGLAVFLTGTERWRRDPVGPVLAGRASELAMLACRAPEVARVRLTVEHRLDLDDPGHATTVERSCPPRSR